MTSLNLAVLFGLCLSPSFAQTVLFEDDFSGDLSQWNVETPWHLAPAGDACTSMASSPPGFGAMVRMGDPDCTFFSILNNPEFETRLDTAQPISIPSDAVNPRLTFDSFLVTEGCNGWDFHWIAISSDMGSTWDYTGDCLVGSWHEMDLDLSDWVGEDILIRFQFWAIDFQNNGGLGWLIDNVLVSADCSAQNYCVAAPNSASPSGAIIGHTGSLSLAQNNFTLTLQDGPPGHFALFFYGTSQIQVPLVEGFLCVGTDANGYRRLHPSGQISTTGDFAYSLDFPSLTGPFVIQPGTEVNFQCWYRDIVNGVSTANFSDARSISFCP